MSWVAVAVAGGAVVGGLLSSNAQSSAADKAANAQINAANTGASAQVQSTQLGIDEQRRQFDAVRQLLAPYASAGTGALSAQQGLLGLNGAPAQQSAIDALQNSPAFTSMTRSGENAILQNASATGGLRGGNVQGALAQFRPALLAQLIQQQFQNLGGITSLGQNAAAGVGNAGMNTGNAISGLLGNQGNALNAAAQQAGAAQAGGALANGRAQAQAFGSLGGGLGLFSGLGGFSGWGNSSGGTGTGTYDPYGGNLLSYRNYADSGGSLP